MICSVHNQLIDLRDNRGWYKCSNRSLGVKLDVIILSVQVFVARLYICELGYIFIIQTILSMIQNPDIVFFLTKLNRIEF